MATTREGTFDGTGSLSESNLMAGIQQLMQQMLDQHKEETKLTLIAQREEWLKDLKGDKSESLHEEMGNKDPEWRESDKRPSSKEDSELSDQRRCTYKEFMGCQPPSYEGNMDPVVTNRWITETELAFRACNCLDIQKTSFAVLRLKGRALTWWNTLRKTLGAE